MTEIADSLAKLGVTGPAALFAIAAGYMLWTYVKNYTKEIETKVQMATAFNALGAAIAALSAAIDGLKDRIERLEDRAK